MCSSDLSPAPLRLLLEGALENKQADVAGNLLVNVLKRRGPPLALPVLLATRPARLAALLAASRERVRRRRESPVRLSSVSALPASPGSPLHALDRIASLHHE